MNTSQKNIELDRIERWRSALTDIANAMDEHDESTHLSDHLDCIIDDLNARSYEVLGGKALIVFKGNDNAIKA